MKKEYHFTLARTDRICLVTFCVALMAWELVKQLFPDAGNTFTYVAPPPVAEESTIARTEIKKERTYNRYSYNYKKENYKKENYTKPTYPADDKKYEPLTAPVNIMEATYDELRSAGFNSKTAGNILKFISSGAIIYDKNQLRKIYGMDSLQLTTALPYLTFPEKPAFEKKNFTEKVNFTKHENQIVDIHTATQEELESLPGIGTVLAERIIKFRTSLGGFSSTTQLMDCYGITPELFAQLEPKLTASGPLQIIYINEVDFNNFSHPYLTKKQIKLLKAYRDQHGAFTSDDELKKVYPPDTGWCRKILGMVDYQVRN